MRAIVYTRSGPPEVLELREVARPVPGRGQVLVRVHAASINALDWRRFAPVRDDDPSPRSTRAPDKAPAGTTGRILGADIAGVVESIGAGVERLRAGDEVFGVALRSRGGFAEFACARAEHLALKPPDVDFDAAAAVPVAALTALQSLRTMGRVRPGQRVLVHGASGGVGTFAVQLGKALGAEVTAVTSARGADLALSLGAVRAIDYAKEDFAASSERSDLVVAVNGDRSLADFRRALAPGGRCVVVGGSVAQILRAALLGPLVSLFGDGRIGLLGIARVNAPDLCSLGELLAAGTIVPVVDRRHPLHAAATAMRYVAGGHARGKVVLVVDGA